MNRIQRGLFAMAAVLFVTLPFAGASLTSWAVDHRTRAAVWNVSFPTDTAELATYLAYECGLRDGRDPEHERTTWCAEIASLHMQALETMTELKDTKQ